MHKPRIIFFDIDGTLIDMEKKRITERTLDALRRLQQNGILLAVATGRSPLIVPKFDGVEFDVFLTYNLVVRCRLQDGRNCSPTERTTI